MIGRVGRFVTGLMVAGIGALTAYLAEIGIRMRHLTTHQKEDGDSPENPGVTMEHLHEAGPRRSVARCQLFRKRNP
jgi:hypothetical protein